MPFATPRLLPCTSPCGRMRVTSEETQVVATSSQALAPPRAREYVAVLIDQAFLETEPLGSGMVLEYIGTAVPVHLNFALSNMDRVARVAGCPASAQETGPDGPA